MWFQSFFYWNWPSKSSFFSGYTPTAAVSILLLLELAFKGIFRLPAFWESRCFNPSSIGIGLQRRRWGPAEFGNIQFQSFFYWNWPSKCSFSSAYMNTSLPFQSFFYWNWPSKVSFKDSAGDLIDRFNPSSIGIGLQSNGTGIEDRKKALVSILLLLELAFKGATAQWVRSATPRFNPSSIGIGLQRSLDTTAQV